MEGPKKQQQGFKEKAKNFARNAALAGGLGVGAIGLGTYGYNEHLTDYSNFNTKEEAFNQAKKDKKIGFMYNGTHYTVEKLEKEFKNK